MKVEEAIPILRLLADGIDPIRGGNFPADSPYQHPKIIRALYAAAEALEHTNRRTPLAANTGKPWTSEENEQLCEEFHRAVNFADIAEAHSRSRGAIISRLEKLGKLPPLRNAKAGT